MAGVCKQAIKSLTVDTLNSLVVGVIIGSLNARTFEPKSTYQTGKRGVWNFTLKDLEEDTINVTVWGSDDYINRLFDTFHIGSVVDVINSTIQARKNDDRNDMYTPTVTSSQCLCINEGTAVIQEHEGPDKIEYEALLKLPMSSVSTVQSLNNIISNIENYENQYINIFVVVTFVSEQKNIITKDGRFLICRDFECTDGSTQTTLPLKLWEKEWVRRSGLWFPRQTVLFISDATVSIDKYKKKLAIMIVRKTLITEDPNIPQAAKVRMSIRTDEEYMSRDPFCIPKAESITNTMTVQEITDRLNKKLIPVDAERDQFLAMLYGEITDININPTNDGVLITRCALCKKIIQPGHDSCMGLNCPCGNGERRPINIQNLYFKVNLKDATGYLIGCRLTGEAAERALGCTVDEFKNLTIQQREDLKWKITLKLCDVRLHVLGPKPTFRRALYNIVSLSFIVDDSSGSVSKENVL